MIERCNATLRVADPQVSRLEPLGGPAGCSDQKVVNTRNAVEAHRLIGHRTHNRGLIAGSAFTGRATVAP